MLPVTNEKAVEYATRIALALSCRVAERTIFHRKNYFYPDLPKAYQISQYDLPLGIGGHLDVELDDGSSFRVGITRVHMEEDAGKLVHAGGASGRIDGADYSLVDFNRGGTPLVEIVTEPDIAHARAGAGLPDPAAEPRASTWASPTSTWRRAPCAATPTSRCASRASPSGPRPSSRT